jgi:microcystin-dependent protein
MGTIIAFMLSLDSLPEDWLPCDGRPIDPKYGAFRRALGSNNTPNLMGRTLIGAGAPSNAVQSDGRVPNFPSGTNWVVGYTGGEYQHMLLVSELPPHNHPINGGNFGIHWRSFLAIDEDPDLPFETSASTVLGGTDNTGGGQGHFTMQPYLVVNYLIYAGPPKPASDD